MNRLPKFEGFNHILFVSGNVHQRIRLFTAERQFPTIFFDNLKFYLKKFEAKLHGFVLMPDYFHLLLFLPEDRKLADFLRDFKSFTAKEILDILKVENPSLLEQFRIATARRTRKEPLYRIFQEDNFVFNIYSPPKLDQKLSYIHKNPVEAALVREEKDWPYSSWRDYNGKGQRCVPVEFLFEREMK